MNANETTKAIETMPKQIAVIPGGWRYVHKREKVLPGDFLTTPASDVWTATQVTKPTEQNPLSPKAYIRRIT